MKKIIYIDDDSEARETYTEVLQEVFGGDFELKDIAPEFLLEDMLIKINDMHSVAGFVLDEKMNQLGQANFVGQSLAKKIRELDHKYRFIFLPLLKMNLIMSLVRLRLSMLLIRMSFLTRKLWSL